MPLRLAWARLPSYCVLSSVSCPIYFTSAIAKTALKQVLVAYDVAPGHTTISLRHLLTLLRLFNLLSLTSRLLLPFPLHAFLLARQALHSTRLTMPPSMHLLLLPPCLCRPTHLCPKCLPRLAASPSVHRGLKFWTSRPGLLAALLRSLLHPEDQLPLPLLLLLQLHRPLA